jgi:hypothetical protein
LIVDLDNNNITAQPAFAELPYNLTWRLYRAITAHMPFFKHYHPHATIAPPANLPNHAIADRISPAGWWCGICMLYVVSVCVVLGFRVTLEPARSFVPFPPCLRACVRV